MYIKVFPERVDKISLATFGEGGTYINLFYTLQSNTVHCCRVGQISLFEGPLATFGEGGTYIDLFYTLQSNTVHCCRVGQISLFEGPLATFGEGGKYIDLFVAALRKITKY